MYMYICVSMFTILTFGNTGTGGLEARQVYCSCYMAEHDSSLKNKTNYTHTVSKCASPKTMRVERCALPPACYCIMRNSGPPSRTCVEKCTSLDKAGRDVLDRWQSLVAVAPTTIPTRDRRCVGAYASADVRTAVEYCGSLEVHAL